jgi:hypothetical protein
MVSDLGVWVRWSNLYSISPGEVLDITALIERVFEEIARRDTEKALGVSFGLAHRGLWSLANLAICKQLLDEVNHSPGASTVKNASKK